MMSDKDDKKANTYLEPFPVPNSDLDCGWTGDLDL